MKWFRKKEKQKEKENPPVSLEEQRAEKLAKMGAQLKAIREKNGFSLEEVVMHTRIPRRLVKGIEEANFEDLPEPVYIKGLVRQYADALGYNGVEFASTFPVGTNKVSLKPIWKNASSAQLRPIHLYLLYVLVILGTVSGLSNWLSDATNIATDNQLQQKLDIPASNSKPTPVKPESLSQINTVTKDQKEVQVGVTLKESSWIQVIADGKTTFEGTLERGSQRTWKAQKELTVKTDNAGGVLVSVNQQQAKQMGKSGKVELLRVALN